MAISGLISMAFWTKRGMLERIKTEYKAVLLSKTILPKRYVERMVSRKKRKTKNLAAKIVLIFSPEVLMIGTRR